MNHFVDVRILKERDQQDLLIGCFSLSQNCSLRPFIRDYYNFLEPKGTVQPRSINRCCRDLWFLLQSIWFHWI